MVETLYLYALSDAMYISITDFSFKVAMAAYSKTATILLIKIIRNALVL